MTNIADILRHAPKGLKLYSSAFGDCKLARVIDDEITIEYFDGKNTEYITLDQYGRFKEDGECILFPYQYKHDWNGWQAWLFRDELSIGKVVVDTIGGYFIITRSEKDDIKIANSKGEEFVIESRDVDKYRFATIEDSAGFFSKVSKNNCYWSNVEKTIIKSILCCEPKGLYCNGNCGNCVHHTDSGCDRKIEYDKSGCVSSCEKFTLDDFKPFDKVLWRLGDEDTWSIGFFDIYYISGENDKVNYSVVGYEKSWVTQCVPYNIDTAYLHDTTEEYDGKYKTW